MKAKLSYKSKRNIVISAIIVVLIALIGTGTYFFTKSNSDRAEAFSDNGMQVGETQGNEGQQGTTNNETNQGEVVEPNLNQNQDGNAEGNNNQTVENGDNNTSSNTNSTTGNNSGTTNNGNTSNNGTTGSTTGNVPNEDYVTERVETEEVLVREDYEVAWSPLTIEANTTTANLSIIRPIMIAEKIANKTAVVYGEELTYTIIVKNIGTLDGTAVVKDTIPTGTTFKEGSVVINGQKDESLTAEDLENGIELNIKKEEQASVEFTVTVNSGISGNIENVAVLDDEEIEKVETPVVTYSKSVDKTVAKVGDILTYTITGTNTGDKAGTIIIKDEVPSGTEYVENSLTINDINAEYENDEEELKAGISYEIDAEETVIFKFQVKVSENVEKVIENIAYVNDIPTDKVETKIESEIIFIENGGSEVEDLKGYAGEIIEDTTMPVTKREGYTFKGWYKEETFENKTEELPEKYPAGITYYYANWTINTHTLTINYVYENNTQAAEPYIDTLKYNEEYSVESPKIKGYTSDIEIVEGTMPDEDVTVTVVYIPNEDTAYTVEFYYQENGEYPEEANNKETRYGTTDTPANVTAEDKNSELATHIFDEDAENVLSGNIDGDGSLVLKVYFKQQYTVTYKPGTKGTFSEQSIGSLDYNEDTPAFVGEKTGKAGYTFAGWSPEVADKVTADATYVAQWTPRNDTIYIVKYYYQKADGTYPTLADETSKPRRGTTDSTVEVTIDDTKSTKGTKYIFDKDNELNVLKGKVDAVNQLELKVYFKLQFTVTYNDGVEDEKIFEDKSYSKLDYDVDTPKYDEDNIPKREGFEFKGWEDEDGEKPAEKVTEDITYTARWEGLQVTKTRTSIDDVDKVTGRTFVDQVGDVIKYNITVKNIGNISVSNITLKDDHNITVTSVKVVDKDSNETVKFTGEKEVRKDNDILSGLDITIEPNETIVVEVKQTITQNDLDKALDTTAKQTVNIATAKITGSKNEYTGQEETDVKNRYPYIIKYLYNGVENKAERIDDDTALVGTIINLVKPDTKTYNEEEYEYVTYYGIDGEKEGSTEITTEENVIEIHYGKPETSILKTATSTVSAGDNIEYTITVKNTGYVGTTITVTDTLVDTTYVSGLPAPTTNTNNKDLSWEITLDAATPKNPTVTKTITFKAKTTIDSIGKTISNTAIIAEEPTKTSTTTTKVREVVVKYNEFKQGQRTSDLNIIFIMDNSQSMNFPAKGYSYGDYPVAPSDRVKTRLYASKSAINSFITNYPNSDISVIRFNEEEPGVAEYPYENYKTLMELTEATKPEQVGVEGYVYTKEDGLKYTTIREENNNVEYHVSSEKVTATDGNQYYAVIKPVEFGAKLIGKASANNTTERNTLKNSVNDIFLSDSRRGVRTNINPAFKMIVDNPTEYLSDTKKNVIIVIADGAFNDDDYMKQRNALVESEAWKNKGNEIYCIGLGGEGSAEYDVNSLMQLSTNGKCESADNTSSLLQKFNEIYTQATGKNGQNESENGIVELDEASQNVQYPIVATYMENGVEKTLFTCTTATDAPNYGLTVVGKKVTWNARTFVKKQKVKVPDVVTIKYHIPAN